MTRPDFEDIRRLFQEIVIPFHLIERDLTLPLPGHRGDNDAEHSWSLAFLATALAPEVDPKLDTGKVAIFAVLHDVVEVYAGDTSVFSDEAYRKTKDEREAAALETLRENFPAFQSMHAFIQEYERKDTDEALFVYSLDKFLNLLAVYEDKGFYYRKKRLLSQQDVTKRLSDHRLKASRHPVIAAYYEELIKAFDRHPEYFYRGKDDV